MDHLENINKDIFYKLNDNISYEFVEDGYIILNLNNGEYFELNGSSSFIWDLISQQTSARLIIETIKKQYDISEKETFDILSTIDKLEKLGLIKKIEN